jgi:hypothetical protein
MTTKWMLGWMVVCGLTLSCTRSWAQDVPEAEPGEIVMTGWVLNVDAPANSFVMAVREYTIPHGRTYRLGTPRAVVVQVPAGVPIHVRWKPSDALTFNEILPGVKVVACGPNKGLAQPLQANNVALWTKVDKGIFSYGPPETPPAGAPPDAGNAILPLPPVAPGVTPKPTAPKSPSNKTEKSPAKSKSRSRK